ncbi:hypothetical protein PFICI_03890 [Pestalotiopsis fici W106-1]|uniref:CN hydrolase domain-containing protein n=1 Tax=Pestalotiopsis fici (strain W106-1 / CGMCC3.15140) TaxID=1229662 RepID=W3XIL7_PESFW|nr:uncharacterized protein PFICI_03890 [Pestalotiopsis fici W106-1]ETS85865.1 hypothetical protein PFICI_03890 [Pestalotiopsis fici W106-1]
MTNTNQRPKRPLRVAAAQLGPIHLADSRESVLQRMFRLLDQASASRVQVVAFPELAFTTFFPRHLMDHTELEAYFDLDDPQNGGLRQSPGIKPLFDHARDLGIDVYVGYAEKAPTGDGFGYYNSSVYYSARSDRIVQKYRKVHLPGVVEPFKQPGATQQLEKRYFSNGDLGFPAFRAPGLLPNAAKTAAGPGEAIPLEGSGDAIFGMLICNDRRWAEGWRSYGLQGAELVFCGYNTTAYAPQLLGTSEDIDRKTAEEEVLFHHKLSCQGNSYMNACFSVNVAKCGLEDGHSLISGTIIVHPNGHILAEASTKEDELVIANIDLGDCRRGKEKTFAFAKHRRPDQYRMITDYTGVVEPKMLAADGI